MYNKPRRGTGPRCGVEWCAALEKYPDRGQSLLTAPLPLTFSYPMQPHLIDHSTAPVGALPSLFSGAVRIIG